MLLIQQGHNNRYLGVSLSKTNFTQYFALGPSPWDYFIWFSKKNRNTSKNWCITNLEDFRRIEPGYCLALTKISFLGQKNIHLWGGILQAETWMDIYPSCWDFTIRSTCLSLWRQLRKLHFKQFLISIFFTTFVYMLKWKSLVVVCYWGSLWPPIISARHQKLMCHKTRNYYFTK